MSKCSIRVCSTRLGSGMETLRGGDLGMLRLKKKTASRGVPRNAVVGLPGRIYKPRFRFLRNGSPHIERQREAAVCCTQIFYGDRLHNGAALARQEHARGKLQVLGCLSAYHTMRKPLILDVAVGGSRYRKEAAIQKKFTGQQKAGTPSGLRHAATSVRRK